MAALAFVVLAAVQSVCNWLLIEVVKWAVNALLIHHAVLIDTLKCMLSKALFQHAHGNLLVVKLAHVLDSVYFMSAARAFEEVESNAHRAPSVAEEVLNANHME